MSHLTIYKASAGSGKTFQLTREYLSLIFNPKISYSSILAVTFTNKATAEMRQRILSELYALANEKPSGHADALKKTFKLSDKQLTQRAAILLKQILHNYGRFNVTTIDSFFQQILKAFTRELGLNVGFSVELDKKQVLEVSIDNFFDNIEQHKELNQWLTNYALQKIEQGKSWDIQKDLIQFANNAFTEVYFSLSPEDLARISSVERLTSYKKTLTQIVGDFVNKLHELGQKTQKVLQQNGFSLDDFAYKKSGVMGFMLKQQIVKAGQVKAPQARAKTAFETDDFISGWISKSAKRKDDLQACVQNHLHPILTEIFDLFHHDFENFCTAYEIVRNIDGLALLVEIFNFLNAYSKEHNIFLLSLAAPLLSQMIGADDAPFIYEKTGEYLKYFMIDEFQDTSQLQWNNFYPLFQNALSENQKTLVVGDVKQSIYRWRNSDWRLLEYELQKSFKAFNPDIKILPNNWRSDKNLVIFNNALFKQSAILLQQLINQQLEYPAFLSNDPIIERIFSTVEQQVPKTKANTQGYVHVNYYESGNDDSLERQAANYMIKAINQLYAKGYQPKDIAVLVRRNVEGAAMANALMAYKTEHPEKAEKFDFVSNDSVFLEASTSVQLLIALLQFLNNEKNELSRATILQLYYAQQSSALDAAKKLMEINITSDEDFFNQLPPAFKEQVHELKTMSLIPLVSVLSQMFLNTSRNTQQPFIDAFLDVVINFSKNKGSDISQFLDWWQETGVKTPIQLSENQNAIRIVTIHKSKGLEYKVVIVPFANWDIDQHSTLMWCKTDKKPFGDLSIIPVMYSSRLANTAFKIDYYQEKILAAIDNLNVLYVAFTRACRALYIGMPHHDNIKTIKNVGHLLQLVLSNNFLPDLLTETDEENQMAFGTLTTEQNISSNPTQPNKQIVLNLTNAIPRTRNKNKSEILSKNDLTLAEQGKVFHKIMEYVNTLDDLDMAVEKVLRMGIISNNQTDKYRTILKEKITADAVKNWFTPGLKLLNEYSILQPGGIIKRPDRVILFEHEAIVIDYKFTTETAKEHYQQVKNYLNLVHQIEKKPVRGYVWYVLLNKIIEVS